MGGITETSVSPLKQRLILARLFADTTGGLTSLLVSIGIGRRLFQLLHDGPMTPRDLAEQSSIDGGFLKLWLESMRQAGYVSERDGTFFLSTEQSSIFVEDDAALAGAADLVAGLGMAISEIAEWLDGGEKPRFGTIVSRGLERLATAKFRRWGDEWLEIASSVRERLNEGVVCVDLGSGGGQMIRLLEERFPASTFVGAEASFDAIAVPGNGVVFCGDAGSLGSVELVTSFESLHHVPDPGLQMREVARALQHRDGQWLVVEPRAVEESPIRHYLASVSALFCLPDAPTSPLGDGSIIDLDLLKSTAEKEGLSVKCEGDTEQHTVLVLEPA